MRLHEVLAEHDSFTDYYLLRKQELKSDKEIAEELYCTSWFLQMLKELYELVGIKKPRMNNNGITEEQLLRGESKGLTRRLINQRVRELGWSIEDAISVPKISREKRRKNGHK